MKRMGIYGITATALLLASGWTGAFSAIAQNVVRPILVKNIDEPGRTPFTTTLEYLNTGNSATVNCVSTNLDCTFFFDFVPGGKRFVVENVSGTVSLQNNYVLQEVRVGAANPLVAGVSTIGFVGPLASESRFDRKTYNFSSPFRAYVIGGNQPCLRLRGATLNGFPEAPVVGASLALNGYLVDLTQ